jgi:hypothetical protein
MGYLAGALPVAYGGRSHGLAPIAMPRKGERSARRENGCKSPDPARGVLQAKKNPPRGFSRGKWGYAVFFVVLRVGFAVSASALALATRAA